MSRQGEHHLEAGDILSYSAGSTQTGPDGYRKLHKGVSLLDAAAERWPDIREGHGERPILFINAYPATVGTFSSGITVDTYLSPRVLTRALQLGRVTDHPVVLLGQPLFLANALRAHVQAGYALPATLMIWVGGYVTHRGVEALIERLVHPHVDRLKWVQFYGAAEVDAGCMMARDRNEDGELIYYPRKDVSVEIQDGELLLSFHNSTGEKIKADFSTGDHAVPYEDGFLISNNRRLHPTVHRHLSGWSVEEWDRRTGYVQRNGEEIVTQLREGVEPQQANELGHFAYAERFGFSWLNKPNWR